MAEGFVILDDVFVPNERIFLDGAVAQAAVFAHSLGLWERLGGLSAMAEEGDQLVGFAQLVPGSSGLGGSRAIKGGNSRRPLPCPFLPAPPTAAHPRSHLSEPRR